MKGLIWGLQVAEKKLLYEDEQNREKKACLRLDIYSHKLSIT